MFEFRKSKGFNIEIAESQKSMLSVLEKIKKVLQDGNVIAFDIYQDNHLIGFAMLRKYEESSYFLWDYAIDYKYQNLGYGSKALQELLGFLKSNYRAKKVTTTYICGNQHAKHIYEKIGFVETDIVDEEDVHEVNMIIKI
ncbi:MAG TPA: GNAT family N-acetyltransferase [Lachnospiraceae bacterium]|nr:GNAT family N-acetyltransferase [Lachnospiraceae bacterium]